MLSTPPAFVLSQDQTLSLKLFQRSLADVNKLIRSFRPSVCPGSSSQTLAFCIVLICYFQGTGPVRRYRARNCILTNSFKFVNTVIASVRSFLTSHPCSAVQLRRWHGIASYQIPSRFVNMFFAVFPWQFRGSSSPLFLPS